ncbi:MAG: TIR domain-containing protein, partial [Anaerolineales bacterium]
MPARKLKVFLCHAAEDKPLVRELYDRLKADGFDPWLDSEALLPGQDWDLEIQKAMRRSDAVIVCFSRVSVAKEGYVQKEIKYAQEIQKEKPEGTIFFIPLQLEACEMPFRLQGIPWGRYYEEGGYAKLVQALNRRAEQVGAAQGGIKSRKKAAAKAAPEKRNTIRGGDNSVEIGRDVQQSVIVTGSGNVINISAPAVATQPLEKTEPSQGGLPPGSHLPFPRNALFTGRERYLEKLAKELTLSPSPGKGGNIVITQAISGMGGVGKTQLAVEFAYRYGHLFKGVHWLDLSRLEALDEQIAICGEKMALQPWPKERPEQVTLTLRAWQTDGPRLLILDNFESLKDAVQVLARFHSLNLRLLIISRRSDWPAALGVQVLPLEVFTPAESRKFLKKKYLKNRASTAELDRLAERLGRLPLALELAGRYLALHPRLTVPQYLTRLEQTFEHDSMRGFRADLPNPTQHDPDLLATFALSWEQVQSEAAQQVFLAAGYCAPNTPIPPEIFEKTAELDETACDEGIQTLIGLGLLGEKSAIHPLLAEFARRLDVGQAMLKKLAAALAEIANMRNARVDQTGNYALYAPLLPHVRAVAKWAERAGIKEAGKLWNSLGRYIHALADYHGAQVALEHARQLFEQGTRADPTDAAVWQAWALMESRLGNIERARQLFEQGTRADPTDAAVWQAWALMESRLGNIER